MSKNTGSAILTPQEYATQTGLETLLNKCVNDCYLTQSACPAATISSLLQATFSVDLVSDISISECLDGDSGGSTAEVRVELACGVESTTIVSHSNATIPFHPATLSNRSGALVPAEVLAMTGPGSIQYTLQPPTAIGSSSPSGGGAVATPAKGKSSGGSGAEAARLLQDQQGTPVGDFAAAGSASALVHASKFQLTGPVEYFSSHVRPKLVATLRATQQSELDDILRLPDPSYASLLTQVASAVSLACAKAAAMSLHKPLYHHIGQLYQTLDDGSSERRGGGGQQSGAGAQGAGVRHGSYCVPNLAISVFTNNDPRSPAKVRGVKEVLLMVNIQNNAPSATVQLDAMALAEAAASRVSTTAAGGTRGAGSTTFSCPLASGAASDGHSILTSLYPSADVPTSTKHPESRGGRGGVAGGTDTGLRPSPLSHGAFTTEFADFADPHLPRKGLLDFRTVTAVNAIVHVAMGKLANVAAAAMGITPGVAEAALMPTATDGAVKAPFFDSIAACVQCIEEAIKEVTGNPNYFDLPAAPVPAFDPFGVTPMAHETAAAAVSVNGKPPKGASAAPGDATGSSSRSKATLGVGGGVISEIAAAVALRCSFAPPPLFTVGLVVDGSSCARQVLSAGGEHSASSSSPAKYCLVQGEPDVTGKQLADTLAHLACVEKPNVLTYIEDSHHFNDTEGMQRLMAKAYGPRLVQCSDISAAADDVAGRALSSPTGVDGPSGTEVSAVRTTPVTLNNNLVIAGNHLFGSSHPAVERGARCCLANHTVLRLNDAGSVSKLLETAVFARKVAAASQPPIFAALGHQWGSASSVGLVGETFEGDGAALAHLAVGIHARILRVGGLLRREHANTLNELVRISDRIVRTGTASSSAQVFDSRLLVLPNLPAEAPKEDVVEKTVKKGRK